MPGKFRLRSSSEIIIILNNNNYKNHFCVCCKSYKFNVDFEKKKKNNLQNSGVFLSRSTRKIPPGFFRTGLILANPGNL